MIENANVGELPASANVPVVGTNVCFIEGVLPARDNVPVVGEIPIVRVGVLPTSASVPVVGVRIVPDVAPTLAKYRGAKYLGAKYLDGKIGRHSRIYGERLSSIGETALPQLV